MRLTRLTLCAVIVLLGGCGKIGDLKPEAGQSLAPKPLMARTTPTPEELLTPPIYARPDRVDELMKKSEPRKADPFDLPPPSGGAAPPPAAQPDLPAAGNTTDDDAMSKPQ